MPTNTPKKSSTRDAARAAGDTVPAGGNPAGRNTAMNGRMLMHRRAAGCPSGLESEPVVKPQRVGDDERRHRDRRVGQDVEGDEQAVMPA
mgnify:CR=1 FL=1